MAKKFDIHEWHAKQRLAEQEEFTPDLEDDDLKRSKIQQMMSKEKENTPVDGGMNQGDYDKVADLLDRYSLGELLDAAIEFYQTGGEDESAELANKFAADFRKFLDGRDEELEEMNVTGTGASFNAGSGEGYMSPNAFGKKKDKDVEVLGYKKVNEQEGNITDKLGDDGEMEADTEVVQKILDAKVNTPEEFIEVFHVLMAHGAENISTLTSSEKKEILKQALSEL